MQLENIDQYYTFKEIDLSLQRDKGTAFRAFKALRNALEADGCFLYLAETEHADTLANLRATNRMYVSSVNGVLFNEMGRQRIRNFIEANASD